MPYEPRISKKKKKKKTIYLIKGIIVTVVIGVWSIGRGFSGKLTILESNKQK